MSIEQFAVRLYFKDESGHMAIVKPLNEIADVSIIEYHKRFFVNAGLYRDKNDLYLRFDEVNQPMFLSTVHDGD